MPDPMRAADRNRRLAGRRIYLTGAASGIGLASARLLANQGAALALVDNQAGKLALAARETGGKALVADLRDGEAIDRTVAEAAEAMGGIDGVVNCAGVPSGADIAESWKPSNRSGGNVTGTRKTVDRIA